MLAEIVFAITSFVTVSLAGRKWEMNPRQYLRWSSFTTVLGVGVVYAAKSVVPQVPWIFHSATGLAFVYGLSVAVILYYFFRNPERNPPQDEDIVLSPADGRIVYIKEISNGEFPFALKKGNTIPLERFSKMNLIPDRGIQIGIAMNFLDVHVNRSPVAGEISLVERIPGEFKSLKHIASLLENERVLMVAESEKIRIGMVQIASRLVRRIVPYVQSGEKVEIGQRVGMIRFGSQVDLLIPTVEGIELLVKERDEVIAGETILGRLKYEE